MTTAATAPTPFSQLPGHQKAGLLVLRIGTAAWIASGAIAKGIEFNPQLLPPPLLKSLIWFAQNTGFDTAEFIEWSLRAIVGAEVFIALAILLSARWARAIAMLTLGFFAIILVVSMVQTAMKDGIVEALTGSCGCFGEKSPLPASGMLAIDLALLLNALLLAPRVTVGGPAPVLIPLALGIVTTFALPEKQVAAPTDPQAPSASTDTTPPVAPQPEATGVSGPWPGVPAKFEKFYAPKWADWIGKPLRSQGLALAIERPLPEDLEKGDWIVTFSRADCDECQAMYRAHFKTKRSERVLKVTVPDSRGTPLGMPCEGCVSAELFRVRAGQQGKSPDYVFQTPVALRMKDGVVTAVCTDFDKPEQVAAVLPPVADGSQDAASTPAAPAAPPATTPATPEAPKAKWLGPPSKLESFYIAEFADATGKPFAEQPFARLLQGAPPADLLSGRWIVIYYREDCDHCHDLLSAYFTGKLPVRTLLVAIPDTDPANALDNPCDECVKATLIKGPNYVIGTPVVVAINDGTIECVIENVDDMPALEACLRFPAR